MSLSLAQVLPLAMFILMVELVVGSFAVMLLADFEGDVGGGFLGLNALIFTGGALFAAWLRAQYPPATTLSQAGVRLDWLAREGRAFSIFLVCLVLYNVATWIGWAPARRAVGGATALAGVAALVGGALAYGQPPWAGIGTILNFLSASLVLGGAVTGMLLGHWYLVAPNLSPRPLRHMTIILFAALAWQLLSLPVYLGLVGSSAAARQGAELLGSYGLILGVRLAIGLLFPLVLAALAWHTARIKAMRSATGLLYVGAGVVLTGEIVAKVLFFIGRLPV
jgi:DMSO reductase anchor subunit